MATKTRGTGAGDKWQDAGGALVTMRYAVAGSSDKLMLSRVNLGTTNAAGYWRFGETQGGLDQTANANNGTPSGPTLTDLGYQFDGNDYVSVANAASLIVGNADFSLEAWARDDLDTTSGQRVIAQKGWPVSGGWGMYVTTSYYRRFYAVDLDCSAVGHDPAIHHWACCRSGATATFFLDGSIIATDNSASIDLSSTAALTIGRIALGWVGPIDEVRLCMAATYLSAFSPALFVASGTFTWVEDGGAGATWTDLAYTATTTGDYEGAVTQVRWRVGDSNPPTGDWTVYSEAFSAAGRYIQIEVTATPKADAILSESPTVNTFTATYTPAAPAAGNPYYYYRQAA